MIIEHNPNYVVLDISMPKGSGFQLLEYLKSKNIRSKVIMLTNYSEVCYRNQAEILGADYFFDKSNEFDKVLQVICQHSHI
jgi:DNA-binding NarL/FixJ family response regulator